MKSLSLAIVSTTLLLASSMPTIVPGRADSTALAFIGIIAFFALLVTRERRA